MAQAAAQYMRNDEWQNDVDLRKDLEKFVKQGIKRKEILSYMCRDYPQYSWSIRSIDRRMRYFDIYYIDSNISVEDVKDAVKKELDGPGQLLGYRAMYKKIRQQHGILVPRDVVHAAMYELDPQGLESRAPGKKKAVKKGNFASKGSNWVHSLDGHDKMMGYQNSTFPLAIYGCLDTASRKMLWLRVWVSNSDPQIIGRWYLDYLYETRVMPSFIRLDHGSETGTMATMHAYLHHKLGSNINPTDSVIYGPSTSNQIERWWKELHERLEKYFKEQLRWLKEYGYYDPANETHRMILAYIMVPLLQKELDIFREVIWNCHRIRPQKDTVLPNGIPDHIHSFPEEYGLEECGLTVKEEDLEEVALQSNVLQVPTDFLDEEFRRACEEIVPYSDVEAKDIKDAYITLKNNIRM